LNVSWRLRRAWSGALRGTTDAEEDEEDDRETRQAGAQRWADAKNHERHLDTPLEQAVIESRATKVPSYQGYGISIRGPFLFWCKSLLNRGWGDTG
jgi:hypothetical protein